MVRKIPSDTLPNIMLQHIGFVLFSCSNYYLFLPHRHMVATLTSLFDDIDLSGLLEVI
jgi:hypothetical protein